MRGRRSDSNWSSMVVTLAAISSLLQKSVLCDMFYSDYCGLLLHKTVVRYILKVNTPINYDVELSLAQYTDCLSSSYHQHISAHTSMRVCLTRLKAVGVRDSEREAVFDLWNRRLSFRPHGPRRICHDQQQEANRRSAAPHSAYQCTDEFTRQKQYYSTQKTEQDHAEISNLR